MSPPLDRFNLVEQLTVAEAEEQHAVVRDGQTIPFGNNNERWRALLALRQDGDVIWRSSSPESDWRQGMGSEFIVLVRDSTVVDHILTRMN